MWFKKKLPENVLVEFEATVLKSDKPHERGSDLNFFVSANDASTTDFFEASKDRGGVMSTYLGLSLYYVGLGVHDNSKTRMRRYPGDGSKPLLPEHDLTDKKYINTPNQPMSVSVVSTEDGIKVWRDGQPIYDFMDENALGAGYFAFRTWSSHMKISHFRVYELSNS